MLFKLILINTIQYKYQRKKIRNNSYYENDKIKPWTHCILLNKDGSIVTKYCSYNKAMKLLNNGNAIKIDNNNNSHIIQYSKQKKIEQWHFKRNERLEAGGIFYGARQYCLVCGNKDRLRKFGMIPFFYVQYFYKLNKKNRKNCYLLLCHKCFSKAKNEKFLFQKNISGKYGIETDFAVTNTNDHTRLSEKEKRLLQATNAAKALKKSENSFPININSKEFNLLEMKEKKKIENCLSVIVEKCNLESTDQVSDALTEQIISNYELMVKTKKTKFEEMKQRHCQQLFEYFDNDFLAFEKVWKQEFVTKLNPLSEEDIFNLVITA